jgi:N-acetylmuramoyl-L-alanine amidase
MRNIKYIVIHCTAGNPNQTIDQLKEVWKKLGWKNNGYHIVVNGKGERINLTPLETITNGVAGHNSNSVHVSYMGGIDSKGKPKDTRTNLQKSQLLSIVKELKQKFPSATILGHRDFSPDLDKDGVIESFEWVKVCPCFDAKNEYKNI